MATKKKIGTKKTTVTVSKVKKRKYTRKKIHPEKKAEDAKSELRRAAVDSLVEPKPLNIDEPWKNYPKEERAEVKELLYLFLASGLLAEDISIWMNEHEEHFSTKTAFNSFQEGFIDYWGPEYLSENDIKHLNAITKAIWDWYHSKKSEQNIFNH